MTSLSVARLRVLFSLSGWPAVVLFALISPLAQANQSVLLGPVIDFPAVGISVEQPHGFQKAVSFHGLQSHQTGASVMLTTVNAPFRRSAEHFFLPGAMSEQGMRLLSTQSVQVNGQPGLLLEVDQVAHQVCYRKWITLFGSDRTTHMVTASFPHDVAASMNEQMRQVALGAIAAAPIANRSPLPFVLGQVDGMMPVRSAMSAGRVALYTRDGSLRAEDARDPLFVASRSEPSIRIDDYQDFARSRLHASSATQIEQVDASRPVQVNGMRGIEIEARGRDTMTDAALSVYQLMLFRHDGGFVVMLGTVGVRAADQYLSRFKKLARTYQDLPARRAGRQN